MITIKDLEKHFGKSFDEIIKCNDIICVGNNDYIKLGENGYIKTTIDFAWEDYCNWEKGENGYFWESDEDLEKYLKSIKKDFYKWVEKCSAEELFNTDLNTFQRHFKVLDNNKVYYLNSYI